MADDKKAKISVLILEDNPDEADLIVTTLRSGGLDFVHSLVSSRENYEQILTTSQPHIILSDYHMPSMGAMEALEILAKRNLDIPLIVVTGSTSEEVVVETMKKGASDYVIKTNLTRLLPAVRRSLETARVARAAREALKSKEEQLIKAQKMEVVGQLAGGVAHDFNNILAAISGYSEFLLQEIPESHPAHADVIEIRKTVERASTLTRQLLAFSRKQIFQIKVLNLSALVSDSGKMLGRLLGETISLKLDLQPDLWPVKADPGQIEQVLFNLVLNSRDAMPRGGRLTIETKNLPEGPAKPGGYAGLKPGDYVRLAVTDTGTGIPEEAKPHLFEPFFTTKEKSKGTGLGLSTVYGIVSQSGGHIQVESGAGKGTCMSVILPRMEEEKNSAAPQKTAGSPGGETILVAEDNDSLMPIIKRALKNAGYNVITARTASEAIQTAKTNGKIDLVVTDIVLPDINGHEMVKILSRDMPAFKVIFMSGYTDDAVIRKELMGKGSVFIQKPFPPSVLLERVREVLDRV